MAALFRRFLSWLQSLFWSQQLELTIVGLQNAGKTTLVNVIAGEQLTSTIPTQGLHMKKVKKGAVDIKIWDLGGQQRFRPMWWRYCRGMNCIVYVVDAADLDQMDLARDELHELLRHPHMQAGTPLLVLGNKNDLPGALGVEQLSERMDLKRLTGREVGCYSISCTRSVNIDRTLEWLLRHSRRAT